MQSFKIGLLIYNTCSTRNSATAILLHVFSSPRKFVVIDFFADRPSFLGSNRLDRKIQIFLMYFNISKDPVSEKSNLLNKSNTG